MVSAQLLVFPRPRRAVRPPVRVAAVGDDPPQLRGRAGGAVDAVAQQFPVWDAVRRGDRVLRRAAAGGVGAPAAVGAEALGAAPADRVLGAGGGGGGDG